ncbi:hypothetical protein [Histidinibacterium lentulum]|uniref:Anti-sigma factor NepR domain-containing protein n=1 Tax=Histidinibacterium lentulum TaxID=2480588 RepID=A0A3N2QL24_9RHOB|nr:hypothetical protein [Histidinibacterium lentulum]ROT95901.1 hypothetical protein EAT49_19795 [Histidinibacterium lentulum]
MDERDADRRAVARGLRRAFAVEPELPDRFRDLLDRLGGQQAPAGTRDDETGSRQRSAERTTSHRRGH